MIWQDFVFMLGSFGFSIALFPSVRKKVIMPKSTTLTTAIILGVFVFAYATLGLWLAALSGAITTAMWWYLFYVSLE